MLQKKNIVLYLKSGAHFPVSAGESVYAKAKLNNVALETDHVASEASPAFESELVWETSKSQLASLQTKSLYIRLDFYTTCGRGTAKLIGYKVLPVTGGTDPATKPHKLQGPRKDPAALPGPVVELGLYVEDADAGNASGAAVEAEAEEAGAQETRLEPVLNESEGYFEVGRIDRSTARLYQFKISICRTSDLDLLRPPAAAEQTADEVDPAAAAALRYFLQYELFGTELATPSHDSLEFKDLSADMITVSLCGSPANLAVFLGRHASIQINVCRIITTTSGSDGRQATKPTVIGTADVDVGGLLQLSDKSFLDKRYEYTGNIPVVAAHSLRTPRDGQRQPAVNVFMAVAPDAELTAARFGLTEQAGEGMSFVSTGELTDQTTASQQSINQSIRSDVDTVMSKTVEPSVVVQSPNLNNSDSPFQPVNSAGTGQDVAKAGLPKPQFLGDDPPKIAPLSPPTKLPRDPASFASSPNNNHKANNITMLGDETDYVSPPPPVKSARLRVPVVPPAAATQRSESVAAFEPTGQRKLSPRRRLDLAADVKLPRKFFIDLARVKMLVMQPALTLSYTYKHLSPETIRTPEFGAKVGEETKVVNGFLQFNFTATQAELESAFHEYLLEVVFVNKGTRVGLASLSMEPVLEAEAVDGLQEWSSVVPVLKESGAVLGHLSLNLHLLTYTRQDQIPVIPSANLLSSDEKLKKTELLAMAARELEVWKRNEKQKFSNQLLQVEAQHVDLLSREWRDREKARVEFHNEKLNKLQGLEKEYKDKLDDITAREDKLEKERKLLDDERKRLKREATENSQRLKRELKQKETECLKQNTEITAFKGKVREMEQRLTKLGQEKTKAKETQTNLANDVRSLREENLKLQRDLQAATDACKLKDDRLSELLADNSSMKKVQANQIQELTENLTRLTQRVASPSPRVNQSKQQAIEVNDEPDTDSKTKKMRRMKVGDEDTRNNAADSRPRRSVETQVSAAEDVSILKKINRLEEEKMMLLRAGHTPQDSIVQLIQRKIDEYTGEPL